MVVPTSEASRRVSPVQIHDTLAIGPCGPRRELLWCRALQHDLTASILTRLRRGQERYAFPGCRFR